VLFRGVYASADRITDGQCHLYIACEAQTFNAQLPFTRGLKAEGRDDTANASASRARAFASEDFHLLGYISAFTNLRALQMHANASLRGKRGYYYILQVDAAKFTVVDDVTVDDDAEEPMAAADEVVLDDTWGAAKGHGNRVRVHGVINVEAIERIWVADREGHMGDEGQFKDVTAPGGHNVPKELAVEAQPATA
jgi:hypothetical protein